MTRERPETELREKRNWFVRATHLTGRTIMGSMTRVRLVGVDRDALHVEGPLIVASNHISNADPVVIGSWLSPALGRHLHWLGKEEAMRWPLVAWAMRQNGVFGVRRGAADVDAGHRAHDRAPRQVGRPDEPIAAVAQLRHRPASAAWACAGRG